MGVKINNDYLIVKLKEFYNILGKIPTKEDFKKNKFLPCFESFSRKFGSFKNACYEANLIEKPLTDKERIEISINELRKLSESLNKCPSVEEYEKIKHGGFSRRVLESKLKMKYNDICRKYNNKYDINFAHGEITKQNVLDAIFDLYNKLGRPPMYNEFKKFGYLYTYKTFQKAFNGLTYNNIIKSLGWIPTGSSVDFKDIDVLLDEFYNYFKEIKRIPYHNDLNNNPNIASATTYIKYFNSIKNVCDLLNIDYDLYYKNAGSGKICLDNKGYICKSIVEKDITNYFIENNIEYVKEPKYLEIIDYMKKIFDWKIKINDEWHYIEYFGMYSKKPRGGIGRKYFKRTKYKIKKLYKHGYINNCIFIFPDDIKNKTLDEIFKPYLQTNNINS